MSIQSFENSKYNTLKLGYERRSTGLSPLTDKALDLFKTNLDGNRVNVCLPLNQCNKLDDRTSCEWIFLKIWKTDGRADEALMPF